MTIQLICLDASDIILDALQNYIRLFKLEIRLGKYDPAEDYSLKEGVMILCHNSVPEEMNTLLKFNAGRESPLTSAVPMVLLSEPLSPQAALVFKNMELTWQSPLPFESGKFLGLLAKLDEFTRKKHDLLAFRKKLQLAMVGQNYERARKLLAKLAPAYPFPYTVAMLEGDVAYALEDWSGAEAAYTRARDIYPESLRAHSQLAQVYLKLKKPEQFQAAMAASEELAEIHLKNLLHWGHIFMDRGEIGRAESAFGKVLQMSPRNAEANEGLLALNLLNGNTEMVQKIIDQAPQSLELARLCNLKGIRMVKARNFKSAETLYRNAMKFLPDNGSVYKLWFNLGLCMKTMKDYPQALLYFERAKGFAPGDFSKVDAQISDMKDAIATLGNKESFVIRS